jgi:hypothetical protein
LIVLASIAALATASLFVEGPPRTLAADEQIPTRIVLRQHPKLGGATIAVLTNHNDILTLMTALPSSYRSPFCACFGFYDFEFYAPTGVVRQLNYKSAFGDSYIRDSLHPEGQASVPRRFKRVVGALIADYERARNITEPGGPSNGSHPFRSE